MQKRRRALICGLITAAALLTVFFGFRKPPHIQLEPEPADTWEKYQSRHAKSLEELLRPIHEPKGSLVRPATPEILEQYSSSDPKYQYPEKANATLLSLARNKEVIPLMRSIKQVEKVFNHKFHYPWVIITDTPLTENVQKSLQSLTDSTVYFETVGDDWQYPEWIDPEKTQRGYAKLIEQDVQHAADESYHKMCRWYSGRFYHHPRLEQFRFYWRVEPQTAYFCDINYDVFRYLQDHNKVYGFAVSVYDAEQSLPSLWPTTEEFVAQNPQFLHPNNSLDFLTYSTDRPEKFRGSQGYSTCHFWSNLEIADMDFWRGEAYEAYFAHLDRAGGFAYERWGDAPVHSIGVGLFSGKEQIHWFRDIGYHHTPYINYPITQEEGKCKKPAALRTAPGAFADYPHLRVENCLPIWLELGGSNEY